MVSCSRCDLESQALHISCCSSLPPLSTLLLCAAATELRRRRPDLQKLKTASTLAPGYRYPPPSLPPSSYSRSTFHPRAGLQGTVPGRSRCHGALPCARFFLRRIPVLRYLRVSLRRGHTKLLKLTKLCFLFFWSFP